MDAIVERLLASDEPSVRYKTLVGVLGRSADDCEVRRAQDAVRVSPRAQTLIASPHTEERGELHPYNKWRGAHWVLAQLADIGYPAGDSVLAPLFDRACAWLLSGKHVRGVAVIDGRARRCGSQEGNLLLSLLTLAPGDARADPLAANLMRWQWPDGGWSCDTRPQAKHSSFHETWIPMRALHRYGEHRGCAEALDAARRAAEVFLSRGLFRRRRDGSVIDERFLKLRYPSYWFYGILPCLRVLGEMGLLADHRCGEALDALAAKRLPDGGFPAEDRLYNVSGKVTATGSHKSLVDWGGVRKSRTNEWVTAEALTVLRLAVRPGAETGDSHPFLEFKK